MEEINGLSTRIRACADKHDVWDDVAHKAMARRYERDMMRIAPPLSFEEFMRNVQATFRGFNNAPREDISASSVSAELAGVLGS